MHPAVALLAVLACPGWMTAQQSAEPPWTLRTSFLLTGSSDVSPEGYQALSAIGLGTGLRRRIANWFAAEFNLAVTSREVVIQQADGGEASQGSIESIPVNVLLQVRPPLGGTVHPYGGAGLNFTPVWEKTGTLDADDIAPTFGLALQLGADLDVSRTVLLNLDLGWNTSEPAIEAGGERLTTINLGGVTFSAGVGIRF